MIAMCVCPAHSGNPFLDECVKFGREVERERTPSEVGG